VIQKFVAEIEKTIDSSSIVLLSNIQNPEIDSYPHHKHTPGEIRPSNIPSIKDILNEISAIILRP